uniref:Uncharacterized protein n=1 Tax=Glossina morsitans morsitans TaxID=37546 RepID=A0A1B0G3Z1_GLOMM
MTKIVRKMAEAGRENLNYDFTHPFDLLWENNSVKLLLKSTIALCAPKSCHTKCKHLKKTPGKLSGKSIKSILHKGIPN